MHIQSRKTIRWKPIDGYPYYEVSTEGKVRSVARYVRTFNGKVWCDRFIPETILKEKDIRGYKSVFLVKYDSDMRPIKRTIRQVHRLVMETFLPVPNMDKLQVNHKDGKKWRNVFLNLEWTTPSENTRHANAMGKGHQMNQNGEMNSMSKLTESDVRDILKSLKRGISESSLAKKYNVCPKSINHIKNNKTWCHINRDEIT